ncbi:MAG: DUF962 domain-containing protein [Xanthomonadales bacterium]|nr:DUF962 domain-containing protein [Xanthomonadales bacterium]
MNTTPPQRPLDRYFAGYAEYYRHPLNQAIGGVAVPAMAWSAVALLWCIPVFGTLAKTGIWAALAMFFAWSYYYRLSRPLGLGMLAVFFVFGCLCRLFEMRLGLAALLWTAAAVFAIGGIAQFVGYRIEGRRPAFLGDLRYLLVGPLWVLARVYRRMGWKY